MKNKEIEELLKGMRDVSNTEGCSMNLDRYLVKLLLSYIEQLETKVKNLQNQVNTIKNNNEELKRRLKTVQQKRDTHKAVRYKLENNRNEAVREIMYMIENCDISYHQGKKLENILKGDSDGN